MPINNNIIIRLVFSFIFFAITLRVLIPIFFDFVKKKLPGQASHESDIDQMIRRQKERLRFENGLTKSTIGEKSNREIQQISRETIWGGGQFSQEIQQEVLKNYSYSITDSKINAFILLCEKKHYFDFLDEAHLNNRSDIKNYLVHFLIFFLACEELREKKFILVKKMASKISVSSEEFALALQIKILLTLSQKKNFKEDRIFSNKIEIAQYSEDITREAIEEITKKEANLWAQGPSSFFEELTLVLHYAQILMPIPQIKNKKDIDTAYLILQAPPEQSIEAIKGKYKKWAMQMHPDKIISQKLPALLEKVAIEKWKKIQEAYDIIVDIRK